LIVVFFTHSTAASCEPLDPPLLVLLVAFASEGAPLELVLPPSVVGWAGAGFDSDEEHARTASTVPAVKTMEDVKRIELLKEVI
jgi:hypothetical protein